jgi:hypothetical protein
MYYIRVTKIRDRRTILHGNLITTVNTYIITVVKFFFRVHLTAADIYRVGKQQKKARRFTSVQQLQLIQAR